MALLDRIDLHAHTTHSDGTASPEALVRAAAEQGVRLLALTDHDTTTGLAPARAAGRPLGVEVADGCEISTRIETGSLHLLAYAFDPDDETLQALLARIRRDREARNLAMAERLRARGVPLDMDAVRRHAEGEIVARPHFVAAMLEAGHVDTAEEAYARWIGDDAPAYVLADLPGPEEAIAAVKAAGGATAVAHPRQLRLDDGPLEALLRRLVDAGLDALEVQHPSHTPRDRTRFAALARRLDLVATGGSDFHGDLKPSVKVGVGDGTIDVRRDVWERLLERREPRR